jgi:hypothetical protein
MDRVVPEDEPVVDEGGGVEERKGDDGEEEGLTGAARIPYVNTDSDAFAKNFLNAYETGNVEKEVNLLPAAGVDFGSAEVAGSYGVHSFCPSPLPNTLAHPPPHTPLRRGQSQLPMCDRVRALPLGFMGCGS